MTMHNRTIAQMGADMAAGDYSSVELTTHYLDRIAAEDVRLNSYITGMRDSALTEAAAADADRLNGAGSNRPLLGIPIAHKDIFCTEGTRTSAGSRMLDNFIAPYSATVVEKFRSAGAITLGKTNMDEFAMGSSNETSFYGAVTNPWGENRVPGGSSGGSAAAVAARLCAGATGTDTGGSIRQPAAFCGITGLKPTYGRISRWGIIAYASSLDQAGPMTRSAEDAAIMLGVMAGADERDSTSLDVPVPDYVSQLDRPLTGLRLGRVRQYFEHDIDAGSGARIEDAINALCKLGATVVDVDLANLRHAIPAYYVIAPAECSANLSRYDGVRFGYRCDDPIDLADLYRRSRSEGLGREVQRRILAGTFALSAGYYDAYYRKAQQVRRLIRDDFVNAFDIADVLIGPTTPAPAFTLGEKTDDQLAMYLQDIFTIGANLAGLPALSMPVGLSDGLPVGLQLIAPHLEEARLLNVAHQYQMGTDFHTLTPVGTVAAGGQPSEQP